MRKTATIVVAAVFLNSTTAFAQSILDSANRAAANLATEQARQPIASSGGNRLLWPGVVLIGGGATLAILGGTALKSKGAEYDVCYFLFEDEELCSDLKETNKALLWSGVAVAGAGGTLVAVGAARSNTTEIVRIRRGVLVRQRIRF